MLGVCRPEDVIHLLHVTSSSQPDLLKFSAPAVDELPTFERRSPQELQHRLPDPAMSTAHPPASFHH